MTPESLELRGRGGVVAGHASGDAVAGQLFFFLFGEAPVTCVSGGGGGGERGPGFIRMLIPRQPPVPKLHPSPFYGSGWEWGSV